MLRVDLLMEVVLLFGFSFSSSAVLAFLCCYSVQRRLKDIEYKINSKHTNVIILSEATYRYMFSAIVLLSIKLPRCQRKS